MSKEKSQDNQSVTLSDILSTLETLDVKNMAQVTQFWGTFAVFWASVETKMTKLPDEDRQNLIKALVGKFQAEDLKLIEAEQVHT